MMKTKALQFFILILILFISSCTSPRAVSGIQNNEKEANLTTKEQELNLFRTIQKYGPIENIILKHGPQNGSIIINICLDKSGKIVSKKINQKETTIRNQEVQKTALEIMEQFDFAADNYAPEVECGDYTISFR